MPRIPDHSEVVQNVFQQRIYGGPISGKARFDPAAARPIPSDNPPLGRLESLFPDRSLDSRLLTSLKPVTLEPDILRSECYREAIAGAVRAMREMSVKEQRHLSRRCVREAIAVMEEHLVLDEYLVACRNILLKG